MVFYFVPFIGGMSYSLFVQYPDVVHFQDAEGKWQEIDNHLIEQKNIEGKPVLRNRQNSMSAEFAKRVGEAPLVAIRKKGGQQLQWTLRGEQSGIEAKIDTQAVCAVGKKKPPHD